MESGGTAAVDAALDALNVSLDHLLKLLDDRGLETFDDGQLVGFVQGSSGRSARNRSTS